MPVTPQSLLDAMDGIAMILDRELRIVQIGEPNWQQFIDANPPPDQTARERAKQHVLGRPVTEFIAGDAVRKTFAELFNSVLGGTRPVVQIDYRCDAPTQRREMRLSVRPIAAGDEVRHLLYQSVLLSAQQRPAIPLFGVPVADQDDDEILTLCAICARVRWPVGAPRGTGSGSNPPPITSAAAARLS